MIPTAAAPGVQSIPEPVSCYNCGSILHFFNACPEPTRNPPFGLAAAQAKGMAGGQGQQNGFKRPKIGNGPVVTRYPVPGPVVTKFPPPPQGMPYHGTHGPQAQYAPQYPPQPLAPTHNFQQPQTSYAPQGYAPQPQYGQYGQYPSASPQAQASPYGIGAMAQYAPTQYQYGYSAPQPHYQQPPQFNGNGYNTPAVGQYAQPPQPNQYQQNTPYSKPQVGYQQPQPYPAQNYQPGYNGMGLAQSGSTTFPQAQQYGPGTQPHYPYQPSPAMPPGYPGAQGQSFAPPLQHYPNQSSQHWQQGRTPTIANRAPSVTAGNLAPGSAAIVLTNGSITPNGNTPEALADSNAAAEKAHEDGQTQDPAEEESTAEDGKGRVRPPFRATPIDWPFDIEWEETIKDYTYSVSVRAVPITTPITLKHEEFPALCKSGSTKVMGKYVRQQNVDEFILPIKESRYWSAFEDDPAFAEIDETLPQILEEEWIEYQQARKAHLESQKNSPSPEVARRTIEGVQSQEPSHHQFNERVDSRGGAHIRGNSFGQGRQRSPPGYSRSRSRTPNLRDGGTPGAYEAEVGDDRWAPHGSVSRHVTPQLDDQKEALLASLGVSGPPKPVVAGNFQGLNNVCGVPAGPSRHDSGYLSGRPSVSSGPDTEISKSDPGRGRSWSSQLPPPPPPGEPRHRGYGNCGSRVQSPTYSSSHSHASSRNESRSASTNPDESPLSPTSAALLGLSAMEGETNGRKRRQGDDHYTRRRPQPRVDAAFSRRW